MVSYPHYFIQKNITGIQYKKFIDYHTGKSSDELPFNEYWKSLEDVLRSYIRHDDHKFDYIDGIAHRKHITIDKVRYIGKESNNLDEVQIFGAKEDSVLGYYNLKEFYDWVLRLHPEDVINDGISRQSLNYQKSRLYKGKELNFKNKIVQKLWNKYNKEIKSNPIPNPNQALRIE